MENILTKEQREKLLEIVVNQIKTDVLNGEISNPIRFLLKSTPTRILLSFLPLSKRKEFKRIM